MDKTTAQDTTHNESKRYRLIVDNAEQAVHLIQKHFGTQAKVLSVRQVKTKGINRFIKAPKLEVIATVPIRKPKSESNTKDKETKQQAPATEKLEKSTTISPVLDQAAANAQATPPCTNSPRSKPMATTPSNPADITYKFLNDPIRSNPWKETPMGNNPVSRLLRKANFDESLVCRFECSPHWERIASMPIHHALGELYALLSEDYQRIKSPPVGNRVAFLGTPSVGKSTALCKQLANDVFLKEKTVKVLKLENDNPNPDDSLRVFCDALEVPLLRDPVDLDNIEDADALYIDLPGCPINDNQAWTEISNRLNQLQVDSRILVINAAYDSDTIKSAYNLGHRNHATHVVFTHMDESTNPTKLWQFLLCGGLPAIFYSYGQNITSDFSDAILDYMMDKTFPNTIIN